MPDLNCRYVERRIPMNLWQSLLWLVKKGEWTRTIVTYDPVLPGDPRYEQAPYEICVIYAPQSAETVSKFNHAP